MKKEDVKLGMKVKIPNVEKTADGILIEYCSAYRSAEYKKQDFLYVSRINYGRRTGVVDVGSYLGEIASSFYIKDLQPYSRQLMLFEDEV